MLVSVIIPTFNRQNMLPRAVDSVLNQVLESTGVSLQIIVVDDGSTDQTEELIARDFPSIHFISQSNKGVSTARNAGLKIARGEWVALLDSDDEWLPHKLETQLSHMGETSLKVCHTQERWVRNGVRVNQMAKHQKRGGWIFQHCLPLCAMSPSSILMHRDVIAEVGLFDESLPACEDYDYWLRLSARFEVAYLEQECIVKYGGHADQLSRLHWGMDRFRVKALDKILNTQAVVLAAEDRKAAQVMLVNKLNILLSGARKHQNSELIADCERHLGALSEICHV